MNARWQISASMVARLRRAGEIVLWQGVGKILSVAAFAVAARVLGPERFGISGIVLAVAMQITTFSSLVNETHLSRRYRRAGAAGRRTLVHAAFVGRLVLAMALVMPSVGIGLLFAPDTSWWLAIGAAAAIAVGNFLPANWILVGQDRSHLVWRAVALGSLVTSTLLLLLPRWAPVAGIDVVALAAGTLTAAAISWRFAGVKRIVFRRRHFLYAVTLVRHGGWLFLIYLSGNAYLYLDVFFLGFFGTPAEAGLYRPASNLAASFHQSLSFIPLLLFPKMLDWAKAGDGLRERQLQLGGGLLVFAAAAIAGAYLFAAPVFRLLYGPGYEAASGPFVVLIGARSLGIVAAMFTWGLIARNQDRTVGLIFCLGAGICIGLNVVLVPSLGMWGSAWAALACDCTILTLSVYYSLKRTKSPRGSEE